MKDFANRLKGGHPNSLGNTLQIVSEVLADDRLFPELFDCYFSDDEVVRLRVSNAMKRVCKERADLLIPFVDRLISEIATIDQASAQWTLASLFGSLRKQLTPEQKEEALSIMKTNLETSQDWIVLTQTMKALMLFLAEKVDLEPWFRNQLKKHCKDSRKAVSGKARKLLEQLN